MRHNKYARVTWSVNDVLEEADAQGISLTRLEAEDFLLKVEKKLKNAMINIGWSVLARELRKKIHQDEEKKENWCSETKFYDMISVERG
ncbi:MAG: hypothetical protein BWX92_03793 [Deltaproteobacteria bacterium ADurb.Bin135]|nr:MAG: hypothetical protein BWX92_03793 [Deltaproteobacteria bacterium ADurb.Bin135]